MEWHSSSHWPRQDLLASGRYGSNQWRPVPGEYRSGCASFLRLHPVVREQWYLLQQLLDSGLPADDALQNSFLSRNLAVRVPRREFIFALTQGVRRETAGVFWQSAESGG